MSLLTRYFKKKYVKDFVLRIDFDIDSESFVITVPPSSFKMLGEPQKLTVAAGDFQMLSKEKMLENRRCVYHDAKTG